MWNKEKGIVALAVAALFTPTSAFGQDELKSRVEQLEQELKVLKRQLELDKEGSAEKAKTASTVSIGAGGFSARSADTNFLMKIRGYIQADARFYPDDHAAGTANDTFLLRRVRPVIEGTVFEKFDYKMLLDFGSNFSLSSANDPFVQDAYVTARFKPWFQVQVGKFKEPVDLERLQSGANLLFVERGYPTTLAPNRDVGVQLQGEVLDGVLSYALGAFNGVGNGASGDFETVDDEKDIAGRIFTTPFKNSKTDALRGIGFGVGASYGNQEGALGTLRSPGQQAIFSYTGASTNGVVADGKHFRIAPQAYYYYGPFGIFGEYILSAQNVRRTFAPFGQTVARNTAWMIAGSYFLTGEENSFKAVTPKNPFNPSEHGWGAFELAARVQQLDIDDDLFPNFASRASAAAGATSWGVGINWHLNKNFKINLDYEQTDFKGGATPLLSHGEKVVLTRAQISF
jgi:phosphate-selective porin OprO and OprP